MFELVSIHEGLISGFYDVQSNYSHRTEDYFKSLKHDQFKIRTWIYQKFNECVKNKKIRSANIIGSGFAVYDSLLIKHMNLDLVLFYDYDPEVLSINWKILNNIRKNILIDQRCLDVILDKDYLRIEAEVVINLSCECMFDFKIISDKNWNKDTIFCLVGSNKNDKGNINVHSSLNEFVKSTGLKSILYSGEMSIENNETKYLVIGGKYGV